MPARRWRVLDLREIDAGLAKARSGAEKSARDLARMRRLYRDSVVTLAQFQDAETADEMARADLETAAVNRRYAVIVAPAAGVVLRRSAEPGENIAAGAPVLVVGTRGGGKANLVEIGLADRDVVSVERGDPAVARFDALPGRAFPGRVTRIGAAADPTTGTYLVEITLDEGGALAAGLVGTVEIRPKRGTPTALVPIESVLEADGSEATVYALSADGARAERRRVTVAFIDGSRVAIADGLERRVPRADRRRGLPRRRRGREGGAMKLLEFPVRHCQFTVVLFAMLAALGVSSWLAIPRGEDPPLHVPDLHRRRGLSRREPGGPRAARRARHRGAARRAGERGGDRSRIQDGRGDGHGGVRLRRGSRRPRTTRWCGR